MLTNATNKLNGDLHKWFPAVPNMYERMRSSRIVKLGDLGALSKQLIESLS